MCEPEGLRELEAAHRGRSGVYVLEGAEEALSARAWMVANARRTLDIQAFIWRLDRAGALLADALVRAAERGVRVRILLDGFGPKPPVEFLAALSGHPNLETRIYYPIGTGQLGCLDFGLEFLFRFSELNHRMHNKSFLMDGLVGIVGGRNFADEYFNWSLDFNFKDRDAFLVGPVVREMEETFDGYWTSAQATPVWASRPASPKPAGVTEEGAEGPAEMSRAGNPARVRGDTLEALQGSFCTALEGLVWTEVRFVAPAASRFFSGRSALRTRSVASCSTGRATCGSPWSRCRR
ncbi:MAG: hypothetical protein HY900_38085 [Deltaproteobacteria bacterium]|nr:hypothetical protein [Deltaproteobacteria bacterium]